MAPTQVRGGNDGVYDIVYDIDIDIYYLSNLCFKSSICAVEWTVLRGGAEKDRVFENLYTVSYIFFDQEK